MVDDRAAAAAVDRLLAAASEGQWCWFEGPNGTPLRCLPRPRPTSTTRFNISGAAKMVAADPFGLLSAAAPSCSERCLTPCPACQPYCAGAYRTTTSCARWKMLQTSADMPAAPSTAPSAPAPCLRPLHGAPHTHGPLIEDTALRF